MKLILSSAMLMATICIRIISATYSECCSKTQDCLQCVYTTCDTAQPPFCSRWVFPLMWYRKFLDIAILIVPWASMVMCYRDSRGMQWVNGMICLEGILEALSVSLSVNGCNGGNSAKEKRPGEGFGERREAKIQTYRGYSALTLPCF